MRQSGSRDPLQDTASPHTCSESVFHMFSPFSLTAIKTPRWDIYSLSLVDTENGEELAHILPWPLMSPHYPFYIYPPPNGHTNLSFTSKFTGRLTSPPTTPKPELFMLMAHRWSDLGHSQFYGWKLHGCGPPHTHRSGQTRTVSWSLCALEALGKLWKSYDAWGSPPPLCSGPQSNYISLWGVREKTLYF